MAESVSLNLGIDYNTLKYKVSAQFYTENLPVLVYNTQAVGPQGLKTMTEIQRAFLARGAAGTSILAQYNNIPFVITDSDGTIMSAGDIPKQGEFMGLRAYGGTGVSFGYNSIGGFGYNRSGENNSLWITNPFSEYRIDEAIVAGIADTEFSGHLVSYLVTCAPIFSQSTGSYVGVPIQLGRGEASLNASVTSVNDNRITWSNSNLVTAVGSTNFTNAEVTSLSGSLSGQRFRVVSYDNASNYLYLDKSGALTNNIIQVAPRTSVTSYTGWNNSSAMRCKFLISDSIPEGIGNCTGTLTYSGTVNYDLGVTAGYLINASTVFLPRDPYKRDPEMGDLLYFNTAAGVLQTGLIIDAHDNPAQGAWGVVYYPRSQPGGSAPNNIFTLKRTAKYNLEYYPQFGRSYTATTYGDTTYPWFGTVTTQAPAATLEVSAGDYDSAFGTVTDTSHFHIGPITLSDGLVLTGSNILLTGHLYNNNPTSTVPLTSWSRFTSANTNVAHLYNGMYSKFGSLIGTYSQAFSTPDILTLVASAKVGSATVSRTINFPVQPPV